MLAHGACNRWRSDNAIPEGCRAEIERRIALPVDRKAGQALGDELYPWAPARRAADALLAKHRVARRPARAVPSDTEDTSFNFGCAEGATV